MYKTNSLTLASYLYSSDEVEFVGVDRSMPRVAFIFKPKAKAEKLSERYFSGKGSSNPLELFSSHRILKDIVFEVKREIQRQAKS